jgi:transposase InsO family protein
MLKMGLAPIYQRPKTSEPHPQHRKWPYLLRHLTIDRPNQVWCADVTYIPMRRGFLYLVASMDWFSRKVLAWRLSNTMDADFCVTALEEAIARFGSPEIFNTERWSRFLRQPGKVDSPIQRTNHHEDAETIFGWSRRFEKLLGKVTLEGVDLQAGERAILSLLGDG